MNAYEDLEGKVALVTGANGGMGGAIAEALAKAGAQVVASDIQPSGNFKLKAQSRTGYIQADVAEEQSVVNLIDSVMAEHNRLDIAVNAAAVEFELARLTDCESSDFDRLMRVNLRGLFLCLKYELKAMLKSEAGSIVNLASTTSFRPGSLQPAYTASKFGVVGLTKQAALDYASDGIRVNGIAPGNIDTPMLRSALERRGLTAERVERSMPFNRFGTPQEIANAALWLCSNASAFTTGHILAVEGGMLNE